MKTIYIKNIGEVKKNLALLQRKIKVGIKIDKNSVTLDGKEENIYDAEKVLEGIEAGFAIDQAMLLADIDYLLETMHLRDFSRRKDLTDVRARLIGTGGKTKAIIERLSDSIIKLRGNTVYIIGTAEDIGATRMGIEKLIRGSNQGKVYGYLERVKSRRKHDSLIKVNDKDDEGEVAKLPYHVKKMKKPRKKKDKPSRGSGNVVKSVDDLEGEDLDDNYDDFEEDDFDSDLSEEEGDGDKKVEMSKIKRKAPQELKDNELTKGIKNLQDPDDEGLEFED